MALGATQLRFERSARRSTTDAVMHRFLDRCFPTSMDDRRSVGQRGEEIAADHLRRAGYRVVEQNVRTRYGEIDIVAQQGDCLVFVEVRTVRARGVMPEESLGPRKQRRMG